jgi:hypothetical protein
MTTTTEIGGDIIDLRDVTERLEEIEDIVANEEPLDDDDAAELAALTALLDELKGYGGDHQWRGDWYPGSMIRDSYFEDYAQDLAKDIGAIPTDNKWPCTCIDWEQAAGELKSDYGSVEFGDDTYWYR